jgi:hypothetical protein
MLWYMSVASTTLQAVFSLLLLRRELGRRLAAAPVPPEVGAAEAA